MKRSTQPALLVTAALAVSCAQLIGADFDDAKPRPAGVSNGGSDSSGGAAGTDSSGGSDAGGRAGDAGSGGLGGEGGDAGSAGAAAQAGQSGAGGSSGGSGAEAGASGSAGESGTGGAGIGPLVINEINGDSPDYVELLNLGAAALDLSGWSVADDTVDTSGNEVPDRSQMYTFPPNTLVGAGERVLIVAIPESTPSPGQTTLCSGYPAPCYQAVFGISNTDGDRIYVLNERGDIVVVESYPGNDAYRRFPDGVGTFSSGSATPNSANTP
jgi:hypothetical protein